MSKYVLGALAVAGAIALGAGVQFFSGQYVATRGNLNFSSPSPVPQVRGEVAGAPNRRPVIISFKELPGPAERALVENHGGTVTRSFHLVNAIAANLPEPAISALVKDNRVTAVEADIEINALDAELDSVWGVSAVGAGTVHDAGNKGTGIRVAVMDSGIDYNHPDLQANYAGGYDFFNNDDDPMDDHSHGTHIAGTIAAADDDAGVVGVAPEARLYGLKVMDSGATALASTIMAAIEWSVDNNIQVTNSSFGTSVDPGSAFRAAYDNANAAGVLMVASAGNSGSGSDTVLYPAKYDSVVAVGALASPDSYAGFSSTGPALEVAAPGSSIYSTWVGGGYGNKSGTSMASPHVVGVAALVMRAGITGPDAVRQALTTTAVDLGAAGWDPLYGYGRVDAPAAVEAGGSINFDPTVAIIQPPNNAIFDNGESITFSGTADDQEDGNLTGSLTWTSSLDGQLGSGGTITISTLSEGTHTISASVTDSGGRPGSDSIQITISSSALDTTPPTAPENLTGGEKGKSIRLSWVAATDNIAVTQYHVIRNGEQIGTTGSTDYNDRNVQNGNTYTYLVRAVDAAGNVSPDSNQVTIVLAGGGNDGGDSGGPGNQKCSPWPACNKN